jgi:hypothetical protein
MKKPEMPAPTFSVKLTTYSNAIAARSGPTYGHVDSVKKYPHARRLRSSWRPLTRPAQPKPPEGDAPPA